ncbi:MAG: PH domain-containing protein, partial [Acidobacteriota bacterium]|nr:PH domain-containing protein [Acidobacteriota bacterium]
TGPIWVAFIIISFIFLLWYPTMRYEISEDKLVLRCGPLKSEILLTSIKEIRKKNLKYHPYSTGWKLPGYCLFKIKYTDEDWVRMYSRAMLKNIILIETDKEKFGITPANEEGFLKDIMEKMERK